MQAALMFKMLTCSLHTNCNFGEVKRFDKHEKINSKYCHIATCNTQCFTYHFFFVLVSGLVCSVLLQKLSKKAKNVEEHNLSTDLTDHAKYSKTFLFVTLRETMQIITELV